MWSCRGVRSQTWAPPLDGGFPKRHSSLSTMSQFCQPRSLSKCHFLKKKQKTMQCGKTCTTFTAPTKQLVKHPDQQSVMFSFLFLSWSKTVLTVFFFFLFPPQFMETSLWSKLWHYVNNERCCCCISLLRCSLQIVVTHWMITSPDRVNVIVWFMKCHKIIPTQMCSVHCHRGWREPASPHI